MDISSIYSTVPMSYSLQERTVRVLSRSKHVSFFQAPLLEYALTQALILLSMAMIWVVSYPNNSITSRLFTWMVTESAPSARSLVTPNCWEQLM